MVATLHLAAIALGWGMAMDIQECVRQPLPEVVSATVIGHSPSTIKPCQPTNVIVEVEVDRPIDLALWARVTRAMSELLRVNGVEYRNRLSSDSTTLNEAARFILIEPAPATRTGVVPGAHRRARVLVEFLLKDKGQAYLFSDPGRYDIELLAGKQVIPVEVDVEVPTPAERRIIEAIDKNSVRFFLTIPRDRKLATPEVLGLIERLAREDTDYEKWLSLSLGLGLYHARKCGPRDEDFEEKNRALAEEVYGWLSPYCTGEITSRVEALAADWCTNHLGGLARATEDKSKATEYRARRDELWRKLADSPYGFEQGARAKNALVQIEAAAKAEAETGSSP